MRVWPPGDAGGFFKRLIPTENGCFGTLKIDRRIKAMENEITPNGDYKRFMVFTADVYYPAGGLDDCRDSFDTLEQAKEFLKNDLSAIQQIFDRFEGIQIGFLPTDL